MTNATAVEKQAGREIARQEPMRGAPFNRPVVDILETADELRVVADMPGAKAEDIDVESENGVLTIHAEVAPRQPEGTDYLLREYGVGDFHRAFRVSEKVDAARISAEYSEGVLVLHLPKAEGAKARKIEVRTS
ncbi:MAG: hypothetical protein AMS25_02080 [Gemmatimonas sp. SM23_52]|nr:MAG: hypothetical protein AMS25_02080 [Gemmatimonas sp. SM23_52]